MSSFSPGRNLFQYEVVKFLREFEEVLKDMLVKDDSPDTLNVAYAAEMLPLLRRTIIEAENRDWHRPF